MRGRAAAQLRGSIGMAALVGKRRLPFRWRNNARETVCRRAIDFCRTQRHGRYSGTRGRSRKVTRRRRQSKVRNWRQSADGRRCLNHSQTSGRLTLSAPASTAVLMASKIAAGPGICLRHARIRRAYGMRGCQIGRNIANWATF